MDKQLGSLFHRSTGTFSLLGNILDIVSHPFLSVTERKGTVYVTGIASERVLSSIYDVLKTVRLEHMFLTTGKRSFTIYSWFLPELIYVLDSLIESDERNIHRYTLNKLIRLIEKNTWISRTKEEYKSRLNLKNLKEFTFKPFDYQQEFLEFYDMTTALYGLRGQLLNASPGAGKSAGSLFLASALEADKIVIVSPKIALNTVWEDTIVKRFKKKQSYWLSNGNVPFTGKEKFIIVHYEYLDKLLDSFNKLKSRKLMFILDESHNLNEINSLRTQRFIDLTKATKARDIVLMSGTIVKASSLEFIPLLRSIDPLFTEEVEDIYRKIYRGKTSNVTEMLTNRLGIVSFKVEKKQLNLKKPTVFHHSVTFKGVEEYTLKSVSKKIKIYVEEMRKVFEATAKEDLKTFENLLQIYKDINITHHDQNFNIYMESLGEILAANSYTHLSDEMAYCNMYEKDMIIPGLPIGEASLFKDIKAQVKYPDLKIRGMALGNVIAKARIDCHVEMVKHAPLEDIIEGTKNKTVVFTNNIRIGDEVALQVNEFTEPALVYGKHIKNLNATVKAFTEDPGINPIIATYAALATAVPLVAADTVIIIDVPFREYTINQAISRVHRRGNERQTYVHYLILDTGSEPNISSRNIDILKWAAAETSRITGIESPVDLDVTEVGVESIDILTESPPKRDQAIFSTW